MDYVYWWYEVIITNCRSQNHLLKRPCSNRKRITRQTLRVMSMMRMFCMTLMRREWMLRREKRRIRGMLGWWSRLREEEQDSELWWAGKICSNHKNYQNYHQTLQSWSSRVSCPGWKNSQPGTANISGRQCWLYWL